MKTSNIVILIAMAAMMVMVLMAGCEEESAEPTMKGKDMNYGDASPDIEFCPKCRVFALVDGKCPRCDKPEVNNKNNH